MWANFEVQHPPYVTSSSTRRRRRGVTYEDIYETIIQQGEAISQQGARMLEIQTQNTAMMQIMQQMQQQQQEYGERNERRMASLTEEMGNLSVRKDDFHEIIHNVGVPRYEGVARVRGRARVQGR